VKTRPRVGAEVADHQYDETRDAKIMITYEARQVIHHYFDASKDPVGDLWKGALIIRGAHGRLHNISREGSQSLQKQPTTLTQHS
jgi:hypothetical protein